MTVQPSSFPRHALTVAIAIGTTFSVGRGQAGGPATAPVLAAALLERANCDGVARLYAQLASESLDNGISIGDVINAVDGRQILSDGLRRAQQVGGPREVGPGLVQVNLEISGSAASHFVMQAVAARPSRSPIAAQRLEELLRRWDGRTFRATGASADHPRAEVGVGQATGEGVPASLPTVLPGIAPPWANGPRTASGTAASAGSPLRTARAAERVARDALREQLTGLPLDEHQTLGALAAEHRAIGDAIGSAVEAAKISGVDYHADGSVEIRISIDGRQVWQALQLAR